MIAIPALALVLALSSPAPPDRANADDPIGQRLFPPNLVLERSEEIGLQDAQRRAIREEAEKASARFTHLQLDLQEETGKLLKLLDGRTVEEARALEQADRVMGLEREIKRTHLGLLIRIKNMLTPEQQARLSEIRRASEH